MDALKEIAILEAMQTLIVDASTDAADRVYLQPVLTISENDSYPQIALYPASSSVDVVESGFLVITSVVNVELVVRGRESVLLDRMLTLQDQATGAVMGGRSPPILGLSYVRDLEPAEASELESDDDGERLLLYRSLTFSIEFETTEADLANE